MASPKINVLSLCTGYGGLDIGFDAGMGGNCPVLAGCERENYVLANLLAKMEQDRLPPFPVWTDVKTFPFAEFRGVDNLAILGGFPCQPFSCSGLRTIDGGEEDPRHLWPSIQRGINSARPTLVFLENVDGLASSKLYGQPDTSVLKHVLEKLEEMGYLAEATSVSAREMACGHTRRRWFILGALANPDNCGGLRRCGDLGRFLSATGALQGEGSELAEKAGCRGARPDEFGDHEWPSRPSRSQKWWEYPRILMALAKGERFRRGGGEERGSPQGSLQSDEQGRTALGSEIEGCGEPSSAGGNVADTESERGERPLSKGNSSRQSEEEVGDRGMPMANADDPRGGASRSGDMSEDRETSDEGRDGHPLVGSSGSGDTPMANPTGEQDGGFDEPDVRGLSDRDSGGEEGVDTFSPFASVGCPTDGSGGGLGLSPSELGHYEGKKLEYLMRHRTRALRLLGNGVVPHQAGRAIRILAPRIAHRARLLGLL